MTLPDKWQQVCGTTGSSRFETLRTSLWWSPSQFPLQRTTNRTLIHWPTDALSISAADISVYCWATLTLQELVQLLGACRDLDNFCSPLVELSCCGEAHGHKFGSFGLEWKRAKEKKQQQFNKLVSSISEKVTSSVVSGFVYQAPSWSPKVYKSRDYDSGNMSGSENFQ